jgi:putative lipoprotein
MKFPLLAGLPLLLLPLLSHADSERIAYTCDNGSRLDISFTTSSEGRPLAVLHFADEAVTLPQVPAASGAQYRNETIRLHTKDDAAVFEDGQGNVRRCQRGERAPVVAAPAAPVASSFIDLGGQVSYRVRMALPPNAVLIIRAQDGARILAEQRIALAGQQVPIAFHSTIDRDLLGKKAKVTVTARIEQHGKLLFINDKRYPALDHDTPLPLDIQLKPVGRGAR